MWLLHVQLLREKNIYGQGCSPKKEVWERRSLTRKKLLYFSQSTQASFNLLRNQGSHKWNSKNPLNSTKKSLNL